MRWFQCTVAYDGGHYIGWQLQAAKAGQSIQGVLEKALQTVLGAEERMAIIACGRTDAGVHAWGQVFSFSTERNIPVTALQAALNRILPDDIRIRSVIEHANPFHARFDCHKKTYRYSIVSGQAENPFFNQYAWYIDRSLDLDAMQKAAQLLLGKHDFCRFTVNNRRGMDCSNYDYRRTIFSCEIKEFSVPMGFPSWQGIPEGLVIEVTGNGFLYKMVRMISGLLVDIGLGKRKIADMAALLAGEKDITIVPAPARGLMLWQAYYEAAK